MEKYSFMCNNGVVGIPRVEKGFLGGIPPTVNEHHAYLQEGTNGTRINKMK
jgi:hypothetical protein